MKKTITLSLIAAACFFCTDAAAQNFENAGEYMQYITQQHDNITRKFLSYNSAVSHGKRARKVEKLRQQMMDEVQESRMNISGMPKFKNDASYRDSSVSFLRFYYNILNDDYSKVVNMEEIAEQSYDEMEAFLMLQEAIDNKMEEANQRIKKAQRLFAEQNNIRLIESKDEMSEKMKKVSDVNEHYHKIYLIFFKPYLQEKNLSKSIEKGNVGGIEQEKSALQKYAQEALLKLDTMKAFEGDYSLIGACKQLMKYYVRESSDLVKPVTDYFLVKERFETIQKDFDKKSDHSKEEIDAYNKAVNDINAASAKYKSAIKELNEQGAENLENWNKTMNAYFDEHMPR